jgi:hypothetical protein
VFACIKDSFPEIQFRAKTKGVPSAWQSVCTRTSSAPKRQTPDAHDLACIDCTVVPSSMALSKQYTIEPPALHHTTLRYTWLGLGGALREMGPACHPMLGTTKIGRFSSNASILELLVFAYGTR